MNFVTFSEAAERLRGKRVALVGGSPAVLDNAPGFVDSHDVVIRVNNYKTGEAQGHRCDVFYSYFGGAIKKTAKELQADGVRLCWCKCPNSKPIECDWHEKNNKQNGIDFTYIYQMRKGWWFCDTFIPSTEWFLTSFHLLDRHIPSTGFSALLDIIACEPESIYMTGFDFFTSGMHNVNERWRSANKDDPIGHRPELEFAWFVNNMRRYPITFDRRVGAMVLSGRTMVAA